MAPRQASKKKESKEDRLARKGAKSDQLKGLVTDLEDSFHQKKLVPASLRQHDFVWQSWQDFAVTIGISPEVTHRQEPPSEGTCWQLNVKYTFIYIYIYILCSPTEGLCRVFICCHSRPPD